MNNLAHRPRRQEAVGKSRSLSSLCYFLGGVAASGAAVLLLSRARMRRRLQEVEDWLSPLPWGPAFHPEMTAELPDPVRRYFLHTIREGAPLACSALIRCEGAMRLGVDRPWTPFEALERISPPRGFLWRAWVGAPPFRLSGADALARGKGSLDFRLWGTLPAARAQGPDVDRSNLGRMALESVFTPAALLPHRGVDWSSSAPNHAAAVWNLEEESMQMHLALEADGGLRRVVLQRWGNPDQRRSGFRSLPFAVEVHEEREWSGYTVPSRVSASWQLEDGRSFQCIQMRVRSVDF